MAVQPWRHPSWIFSSSVEPLGGGHSLVEAAFWLPSSPVGMKQACKAPGIALYTNSPALNYPIREANCLTGHIKDHAGFEERG